MLNAILNYISNSGIMNEYLMNKTVIVIIHYQFIKRMINNDQGSRMMVILLFCNIQYNMMDINHHNTMLTSYSTRSLLAEFRTVDWARSKERKELEAEVILKCM